MKFIYKWMTAGVVGDPKTSKVNRQITSSASVKRKTHTYTHTHIYIYTYIYIYIPREMWTLEILNER